MHNRLSKTNFKLIATTSFELKDTLSIYDYLVEKLAAFRSLFNILAESILDFILRKRVFRSF